MIYLTISEALRMNEKVMAQEGQQSIVLDEGKLEGALMRPQMAAYYEAAGLARQTALLVSGIA